MISFSLFDSFYKYIYTPIIILILRYYKADVGKNVSFSGKIRFEFKENLRHLKIADGVCFWGDNFIKLRDDSQIIIEENVRIGKYTQLIAANNKILSIGKQTTIGHLCNLVAGADLIIEDDCQLAGNVGLFCSDHIFKDASVGILQQGYSHKPIYVRRDTLISANCTVLKGSELGEGCVIGANSIVNGSIEPFSINVGNPLQVLKYRK